VQVAGGGGRLVLACEDRQVISWSCTDTDIQAAKVAKVVRAPIFVWSGFSWHRCSPAQLPP